MCPFRDRFLFDIFSGGSATRSYVRSVWDCIPSATGDTELLNGSSGGMGTTQEGLSHDALSVDIALHHVTILLPLCYCHYWLSFYIINVTLSQLLWYAKLRYITLF